MASTTHNPAILLKRVLCLTESSPLILCLDSVAQTSNHLIDEIIHNTKTNSSLKVIYVAFETLNKPDYASHFIEVTNTSSLTKTMEIIQSHLPSPSSTTTHNNKKILLIIDSLNYIPNDKLAQFVSSIASPNATLVATYHKDFPEVENPALDNYPSSLELIQFMATSVINIYPKLSKSLDDETLKYELDKFNIPRGLNNQTFNVNLINRRKSGRSITYSFQIDSTKHTYDLIKSALQQDEEQQVNETPEMLQDLTTFNLSTSAKQKKAKDQVSLPFLEAQSLSSHASAIVYEYEKDDDYDEEDPYEDPF
ncbi:hypothetical protein NCAS_0F02250 [Naumovozyma castellii]|uniref:Elongator complex protein 5 n=1 Tax=Naumovozyma castellii TaxID=27288 RepID=G0VGT8_NAUCA|nr:hypothetical protein NCAS_0F02250 [Naumovozyma castellii CBS 4309]CCC70709.1 hypothetical protein NCAS_0F02250 [Naumovozyma castellii CBS 4309]